MINYFKIYLSLIKIKLLNLIEYPKNLFIGVFSDIIKHITMVLSINIIFSKIYNILGWEKLEILYMYFMTSLIISLFTFFFGNIIDFSNKYIKTGDFDQVLLKPAPSLFYILSDSIVINEIGNLFVNYISLIILLSLIEVSFLKSIIIVLLYPIIGLFLLLPAFILICCISFKLKETLMANKLIIEIAMLAKYPITIYPYLIQKIVLYIIPIGLVTFNSVVKNFYLNILYAIIFAILYNIIAYIIWNKSISSYESTGS